MGKELSAPEGLVDFTKSSIRPTLICGEAGELLFANSTAVESLGMGFVPDGVRLTDVFGDGAKPWETSRSGSCEMGEFCSDVRFAGKEIGWVWMEVEEGRFLILYCKECGGKDEWNAIEHDRRHRLFEQLVEMTDRLVYVFDIRKGKNRFVNGLSTEILGYSPAEVGAMGTELFSRVIHPDDLPRVGQHMEKVATGALGEVFEIEYRVSFPNGTEKWLLSRDAVFKRDDLGTVEILGMAEDITSEKLEALAIEAYTLELSESQLELEQVRIELEKVNSQLKSTNDTLEALSYLDSLTGLANRRCIEENLAELTAEGVPFVVVMADIDHFKKINDEHGHEVGDEVLRQFAKLILDGVRGGDIVGRYGGEEFIFLFRTDRAANAQIAAERIRSKIADYPWEKVGVTASFGVSAWVAGEEACETVRRADKAMYAAKAGGRNRVMVDEFSSVA